MSDATMPSRSASFRLSAMSAWQRAALWIFGGWAVIGAVFWRDVAGLADVYWNVSIFEHCLLVPPIVGFLVWQRWAKLREVDPAPWLLGLAPFALGMAAWLAGFAAEITLAKHLGLVLMLQGWAVAMLGKGVSRALLFPLLYAFFLVPVGDQLVPPMQSLTADMAMGMLAITGIPATIDGIFITTPAGLFKVAEACAGVNFLIAMFAFATLVCFTCFNGWKRRAIFFAGAMTAPILANGVRAWGTIYMAELTSIETAAGFDHIIYGWFFFALVVVAVLAAAWRWFDREPSETGVDWQAVAAMKPSRVTRPLTVALGALLLAAPALWFTLAASPRADLPEQVLLPDIAGWQNVDYEPATPWWPQFDGASHSVIARYRNADGATIDLFVALYDRQEQGREVISYGQGAADGSNGWAWTADTPPYTAEDATGLGERVTRPIKNAAREAATFYRIGGEVTGDASRAKWLTLEARLTGGDPLAAAVIVSAPASEGRSGRKDIEAFLRDLGPIGPLVDRVAQRPAAGK